MKNNNSGGYVAILVVLISVAIVAFLMADQYQRIAARDKQISNSADNSAGTDTTSAPIMPIDRALDVKATLEARDRFIMSE